MILAGLIGALSASSGGQVFTHQASWTGINVSTAQEGQENYFTVNFTDWDGSSTFFYYITSSEDAVLTSQFDTAEGTYVPAAGNSSHNFYFTSTADSTTDGAMNYQIKGFDGPVGVPRAIYFNMGPYTIRDSSQVPALVLSLDPSNWDINWFDSSGLNNDATTTGVTFSGNNVGNGGNVLVFNGNTSYAGVSTLNNSIYGSVTVSAWIKPSAINSTQTIVSKELCYKLNITSDGRIVWMVGSAADSSWTITMYSGYDLTAGAWHHVMATVDATNTKIFINGALASVNSGVILVGNGQQFNIGTYAGAQGDFFGGRMGKVKLWNYATNATTVISEYNTSATRYGLPIIPLSLDFPGSGNPYVEVSDTMFDWNLGTTYTIEYWSKATDASTGVIRTVMSQGGAAGRIDLGYANGHLLWNGSELIIPEPTPGVWTHVALVRETGSGNITLYYNGVNQTTFNAGIVTAGASVLTIGRRGAQNIQHFYGKLSMIRVSTTAKYLAGFNPSVAYGVEADTKLMLGVNPYFDSTGTHPISVQGAVSISTDFPVPSVRLVSGTALGFNGTDNHHVQITGTRTDWNLGDNWTIEWWQKIPVETGNFLSVLSLDANVGLFTGIDVYINAGFICMFNGNITVSEEPATRGQWNHIAIQKNGTTIAAYINGISRTVNGALVQPGTITSSSPLDLVIGSRTATGGETFWGQYFNGQLANIRISDIARYSGTFTPSTTVAVDANTRLALSGQVGGDGMLVDASASNHTITNVSATIDTVD